MLVANVYFKLDVTLLLQVLLEEGLGKYCDPDLVRTTQRELAEAINLTQEEMDLAAHQIMQLEHRQSMPHMCLETNSPDTVDTVAVSLADSECLSPESYDPLTEGLSLENENSQSSPKNISINLEQAESTVDNNLHGTEDTNL